MADPVVLLATGDVVGPNTATDGTMVLFDGNSGKKVRGNGAVVTVQGLALLDDVDPAANRATIGLSQVNNTSDLNKPVSTAQQTAINLKANKGANSDITSITGLTTPLAADSGGTGYTSLGALKSGLNLNLVDNTTDVGKPVSTAQQTALNLKANKGANSDITSITGLTTPLAADYGGTGYTSLGALKSAMNLNLVDNTTDVGKPVSTAQQTALNLKANLVSPAFTGAPTAPTTVLFDYSTKVANMAAVKAVGAQYSSLLTWSGALVGLPVHIGGMLSCISSGTAPSYSLPTGVPNGSLMRIQNWSGSTLSLSCQSTDKMQVNRDYSPSAVVVSIVGDTYVDCIYFAASGIWWLSGTGVVGTTIPFQSLLSSPGFQRLPSGLIIQGGMATSITQATGVGTSQGPTQDVNFPIAFPNGALWCQASYAFTTMISNAAFGCGCLAISKTQLRVQNNYTASAGQIWWLAIGY